MLTVITPATTRRLTTVAAIKAELSLVTGADDPFIADLIARASATVERFCNRVFALETVRESVRLTVAADALSLGRWPVVSILSIIEGGKALTSADYETDGGAGFIHRLTGLDRRCDWPVGKVTVEYTAGYVAPGQPGRTLPEDIERATIMLVKAGWFARSRDPMVRTEDVSGVMATTYWVGGFGAGVCLPPDVEGLLFPHRQPSIG
ncbi:hypothetical protein [Azospirillum griseum]|uniref:Phage gp6-like head-tail connector protein n=1 Tax=Azospirillum griseum TaxID=2496639 RepID=A0A431VPC7_9PROT|nr:hypothetical protein [Azospirillum griseum]RTR24580.1 hypothetical protein EJ903_02150 [Azospirillum griseum]